MGELRGFRWHGDKGGGFESTGPDTRLSPRADWVPMNTNGGYCAVSGDGEIWSFAASDPELVAGGTRWAKVSSKGYAHFAIDAGGALFAWGEQRNQGTLGVPNISSPLGKVTKPWRLRGAPTWSWVDAEHQTALSTDGRLWAWGVGSMAWGGHIETFERRRKASASPQGMFRAKKTEWDFYDPAAFDEPYEVPTPVRIRTSSNGVAIGERGELVRWGAGGPDEVYENDDHGDARMERVTLRDHSPFPEHILAGRRFRLCAGSPGYHRGGRFAALEENSTLWAWGWLPPDSHRSCGSCMRPTRYLEQPTAVGEGNWTHIDVSYVPFAIGADGSLWVWSSPRNRPTNWSKPRRIEVDADIAAAWWDGRGTLMVITR